MVQFGWSSLAYMWSNPVTHFGCSYLSQFYCFWVLYKNSKTRIFAVLLAVAQVVDWVHLVIGGWFDSWCVWVSLLSALTPSYAISVRIVCPFTISDVWGKTLAWVHFLSLLVEKQHFWQSWAPEEQTMKEQRDRETERRLQSRASADAMTRFTEVTNVGYRTRPDPRFPLTQVCARLFDSWKWGKSMRKKKNLLNEAYWQVGANMSLCITVGKNTELRHAFMEPSSQWTIYAAFVYKYVIFFFFCLFVYLTGLTCLFFFHSHQLPRTTTVFTCTLEVQCLSQWTFIGSC